VNSDIPLLLPVEETIHDVVFENALDSKYGDKTTRFVARIAGKDQVPYIIPANIVVECGETAGALCAGCACVGKGGKYPYTFHPNDTRILSFLRCTEETLKAGIKKVVG